MCISVKKFQRTKFDVSQKPLIQKMHTEPEILNWMRRGVFLRSLTLLHDPAATAVARSSTCMYRYSGTVLNRFYFDTQYLLLQYMHIRVYRAKTV